MRKKKRVKLPGLLAGAKGEDVGSFFQTEPQLTTRNSTI